MKNKYSCEEIPGPTWGDLFEFIEKNQLAFPCDSENRHLVKMFCDKHDLDFEKICIVLDEHGGFCDCEVVINAQERLWEGKKLILGYSRS